MTKAPFSLPLLAGVSDGEIELGGSLRRPELGGELAIETAAGTGFCVRAVLPGPGPAGSLP